MTQPPSQQRQSGKTEPLNSSQSSASAGTLYLVFIQVISRALTFAGNQFLLRYLSPAQLGLAVQLELLSVTILYTSRESLRVALQRQPQTPQRKSSISTRNKIFDEAWTLSQQTVNLAYLVLLVGLCASCMFGYGYLRQSSEEVLQSRDFWLAFRVYGLATFVELLSEPLFVVLQQHSLYKARARAETGAAISRCLSACLTAIILSSRQMPPSVLPFAVGQCSYAGTLFVLYLAAVLPVANVYKFSLLPHKIPEARTSSSSAHWLGLFATPLLTLMTTFYAQSVFKLLLTQGDSLILSLIADLQSQGAFALASNYGGLLSRLLFQPVEESSRNVFGRLLASGTDVDAYATKKANTTRYASDERKPHQQRQQARQPINGGDNDGAQSGIDESPSSTVAIAITNNNTTTALAHLTTTLHLYLLFSIFLIALLPHTLPPLIQTLVGSHWSTPSTAHLLAIYSYYLPFLAVNGILDAFVTSVASPRQLRVQSIVMFVVTIVSGVVAWLLMAPPAVVRNLLPGHHQGIGPAGLAYANVVSMALRIAYSVWFVRGWVHRNVGDRMSGETKRLWNSSTPNLACIVAAAAVTIGLNVVITKPTVIGKSFMGVKGLDANDIGYLLAGGIVLVTTILAFERQFLISTISTVLPQRVVSKLTPYLPKQRQKQQ